MATDALLTVNYSDGKQLCALYIRYDSHPEYLVPEIQEILTDIDNDYNANRLNWDWLAPQMIAKLIINHRNIRIIPYGSFKNFDLGSVIHTTTVQPNAKLYESKNNSIIDAVKINYSKRHEC